MWDRCSVMRVSESVRLVLSVIRDTGVGQMQCNEVSESVWLVLSVIRDTGVGQMQCNESK